ncbi:hypothetical protein Ae201684P_015396 [Aphanomyces euteiches]|nr:hypothetical protein Ae201684P_015396 [Aphanomyces euteiches]
MWTSFKDREDLAWPLVVTASLIVAGTMILRFLWKTYQLSPIPQPESSSLLFGNLFDTLGGVARWRENGATTTCQCSMDAQSSPRARQL